MWLQRGLPRQLLTGHPLIGCVVSLIAALHVERLKSGVNGSWSESFLIYQIKRTTLMPGLEKKSIVAGWKKWRGKVSKRESEWREGQLGGKKHKPHFKK